MILHLSEPKAPQHLSLGFDSVPEPHALSYVCVTPLSGVVDHNCAGLTRESSTSKIGDVHKACVVPAAEPLLPELGKPPDPGEADACSNAPPETPHPAVGTPPATGRVDGGTETPAEAQYSVVGTPPTKRGADAITDLTPLQLALMTSKPQVGDLPTKRGVGCRPVPFLADPDRTCVSTGGPPESTSAPDPPSFNMTV
nr:actin-binding protein WASF2-like [Nothobranchius furzeri]